MLIILNVLPVKFASSISFKAVILVTFIFSIPDFLQFFIDVELLTSVKNLIPFANYNLGWVLPAITVLILVNLIEHSQLIKKLIFK